MMNRFVTILPVLSALFLAGTAFADGGLMFTEKATLGLAAALAIGIPALGGTLGQGRALSAALEGVTRNPQAAGKVMVPMILGMALIESLVLFGFLIANGMK